MKIGDKVRFLSEVGGGRVAGFQGKNIVLVEDEDGFQVPMQTSEVVVIGEENYDTGHIVEVKQKQQKKQAAATVHEPEPADLPVTFQKAPEERKGGDQLSAYLAFVPMNVKELMQTRWFGRERFHTGDALNRVMTDVDTVTSVICQDVPEIVTTLAQMLAAGQPIVDGEHGADIVHHTPFRVVKQPMQFC